MSYLSTTRLVFSGRFLSDVSTRNNEVENYDTSGGAISDLWNPIGGATFELAQCRVTGLNKSDDDPLMGALVTGIMDRPSGKMVDLDPEWQWASEIWGLGVRVSDPDSGELGFQGDFSVASFRDLWTRQIAELRQGDIPNRQPSGARYVSTLTNVEWGPFAERSDYLSKLRIETEDHKLSIALHQFGYFYTLGHARHATGSCIGIIAPYKSGEPESVLVARRIVPFVVPNLLPNRFNGQLTDPGKIVDAIDFEVDTNSKSVSFDLGHALPLDSVDGEISNIFSIYPPLASFVGMRFGLKPSDSDQIFTQYPAGSVPLIGQLSDISGEWYRQTGGVIDFQVDSSLMSHLENSRVALFGQLADDSLVLLSEETDEGIYVRADKFVGRMEAGDSSKAQFHCRKFGQPVSGIEVFLGRVTDPGLSIPEMITSDATGIASVNMLAIDPGNPRGPLDGAIFPIPYSSKRDSTGAPILGGTGLGGLDVLVVHVRDVYEIPENTDFDRDIAPIMSQYDQLYPIMSAHLFKLADKSTFIRYRQALLTAFKHPIDHPNHMPVTRDLSRNKTTMIISWLESQPAGPGSLQHQEVLSSVELDVINVEDYVAAFDTADKDAKIAAARQFSIDPKDVADVPEFESGGLE